MYHVGASNAPPSTFKFIKKITSPIPSLVTLWFATSRRQNRREDKALKTNQGLKLYLWIILDSKSESYGPDEPSICHWEYGLFCGDWDSDRWYKGKRQLYIYVSWCLLVVSAINLWTFLSFCHIKCLLFRFLRCWCLSPFFFLIVLCMIGHFFQDWSSSSPVSIHWPRLFFWRQVYLSLLTQDLIQGFISGYCQSSMLIMNEACDTKYNIWSKSIR